jgi:hypothetical protein
MGDDVHAGELTGPEGQHIVDHVADHRGGDQAGRIGVLGEEVPPPHGPGPKADGTQDRGESHPAPRGALKLCRQHRKIDGGQEVGNQAQADGESDDDLQARAEILRT